jgi:hypothetical protein
VAHRDAGSGRRPLHQWRACASPLPLPAAQVVVDRLPRREVVWQQPPGAARPQDVEDCLDDLALFHLARASTRHCLQDFLDAYNFARRLKSLSGLTPYEFICKSSTSEPEKFILNPIHQMSGLNL